METWLIVVLVVLGMVMGWVSTVGAKSQFIRLLDILIYGPALIYAGAVIDDSHTWLKVLLIIIGSSTIAYNLVNFIHTSNKSKSKKRD